MKKRKLILYTALSLLILSLVVSFAACNDNDTEKNGADTDANTESLSETVPVSEEPTESEKAPAVTTEPEKTDTEEPTETVVETETETETETEPETEPETRAPLTDGVMIYHEDFESYGNIESLDATVDALGWRIQTVSDDWAYSDWTAQMSIQDGRLYVYNYWDDPEADDYVDGKDGYVMILDADYMKEVHAYGDYTLQFDLTYTGASNYKRYIAIVTEYDGELYHSFHFRIGGYGNNQTHLYSAWSTIDMADGERDQYAATTKNNEKGTTIANKLLGITENITDDSSINNFLNVPITIRICHDADVGNIIYMKTADMADFICVSTPVAEADGTDEWFECEEYGMAVCLKTGGKINGYVDNISLWTGFGEMPEDTTVTYTPAE